MKHLINDTKFMKDFFFFMNIQEFSDYRDGDFDVEDQHFRCLAHVLNLGVQDTLKMMEIQCDIDNVYPDDIENEFLENHSSESEEEDEDEKTNISSTDGYTHFHAACQYNHDDELDVVQKFLELGQVDPNSLLPKTGDSPLHLALTEGANQLAALLLLRHGANPNLANGKGLTSLHLVCSCLVDEDFLELFYDMGSAYSNRPLEIDITDDLGRTPLQLALAHGLMITAEFLLRRGADPNIANASGETALHAVCKFPSRGPSAWYYNEYDLTLMLFECSRDRYKPLRVNARNSKGKTPLELAVANHMPDALEVLLDHGADIAGFVYPAANYVDDELEWIIDVKWRELLGALLCAKRLAKRGYELIWSDALKIMKMFARYGFFEKSDVDLQRSLLDNEGFASRAKSLLVKEDLRLHDLIQLQRPEEVDERVTYQDMFDFVKQDISRFEFDKVGAQEACAVYICEMMSKRFFQSWALYPFWKLIHCRLPLEMCETVLANLKNEDLYHICLATQDQSRDDSKKDVTASVMNCDNNKRPRESEDQVAPKRAKISYLLLNFNYYLGGQFTIIRYMVSDEHKTVAIARYTITETKIN
ncbi:unnamed protein product [Trichogramma brassicae]|uniref:Uncharacterized protein n=1 Tax=Trichogramma brassicae TaxID=86971 RepID=A0A6H5IFK3_9HYME|nr:unnamed protein product [Trichogramma brassicae]